jgi:CarD family transcriptional regulator
LAQASISGENSEFSRNRDHVTENSVVFRVDRHCTSTVIDIEDLPRDRRQASPRAEHVAKKPHGSMGIRWVLSLPWRCWLLGLIDGAAAKISGSGTCRVIDDRSAQHPKGSNRDMSFFDQSAKSGRFPETSGIASEPRGARQGGKTRLEFKTDDFVVYPAHGVGQIISIEEQTIAGASIEFFVIFFTKNKLTVRVPVRKAANVGMRKPSDPSSVRGVKQILSETARKGRGNWSRLAQEYESKINSGDIVAIAEVARDLFRPGDSGQSFSERQLYVSALDRLCREVALVDGITEERAAYELEGLLKTGKLKRSA